MKILCHLPYNSNQVHFGPDNTIYFFLLFLHSCATGLMPYIVVKNFSFSQFVIESFNQIILQFLAPQSGPQGRYTIEIFTLDIST